MQKIVCAFLKNLNRKKILLWNKFIGKFLQVNRRIIEKKKREQEEEKKNTHTKFNSSAKKIQLRVEWVQRKREWKGKKLSKQCGFCGKIRNKIEFEGILPFWTSKLQAN